MAKPEQRDGNQKPPTGKRVEVPLVAIVRFRDSKLAHEHIYWDQVSLLVQIGLIDAAKLSVAGQRAHEKSSIQHCQRTS